MNYNSDRLSNLGRQATSFWYIDFWISDLSTFKTELLNSILSNINNEKKKKKLKTRVRMFKNMSGNIPGGNFLGGNFPGGNFPGRGLMCGNFPGGSSPDTIHNQWTKLNDFINSWVIWLEETHLTWLFVRASLYRTR